MNIRTSTPFVVPKIRIIRENNCAEDNKHVKNEYNFGFNSPTTFDFHDDLSGQYVSYFDIGNKIDDIQSTPNGPLKSRISNETESVINCLKNCSISESGENIEIKVERSVDNIENSTLKVSDASVDKTLFNDKIANLQTPDSTTLKNESMEHRKLTIVQPFSFELREKIKSEHKLERSRYFQILRNEQLNASECEPSFVPHTQIKKEIGQANTNDAQKITIPPWKKKPFQVKLQKRQLTIPKSPKLCTSERARIWKLKEESSMQREKQEIERLKKTRVAQKQYGKVGVAAYRKQTVKTVPHPNDTSAIVKRPACDPMFSQITKRRRRI
ncbi:hypothetical protein PV327_008252 [Microctonus hyperodae]|uniref:Uncharacterized protein n=1 Tax=Microctonus hyperodae TaxID=165561 RepID=A0AA39KGV5_MICHY|nr:hypothetical protein PV327_008252 [Microctonus hyperodae]